MEENSIEGIKTGDTINIFGTDYKVVLAAEKNGIYNLSFMKPNDKRLTNPRNTNGLATINRKWLNGNFLFTAYADGNSLYASKNYEEVIAWCYDHKYFFECDW